MLLIVIWFVRTASQQSQLVDGLVLFVKRHMVWMTVKERSESDLVTHIFARLLRSLNSLS